MQCATCGNDNLPQARFCARCGTALAVPPTLASALQAQEVSAAGEAKSVSKAPATAVVRISIFPAAVGFILLGLVTGAHLLNPLMYPDYYYTPIRIISHWVGVGAGVAAALWLTLRIWRWGRLPSALGMVLIFVGAVIYAQYYYDVRYYHVGPWRMGGIIIGLGFGLLFPLEFWRHIAQLSLVGKAVLAMAAVAGVAVGWQEFEIMGGGDITYLLAVVLALFVGLPAVLIAPVVRTSKATESSQRIRKSEP